MIIKSGAETGKSWFVQRRAID